MKALVKHRTGVACVEVACNDYLWVQPHCSQTVNQMAHGFGHAQSVVLSRPASALAGQVADYHVECVAACYLSGHVQHIACLMQLVPCGRYNAQCVLGKWAEPVGQIHQSYVDAAGIVGVCDNKFIANLMKLRAFGKVVQHTVILNLSQSYNVYRTATTSSCYDAANAY